MAKQCHSGFSVILITILLIGGCASLPTDFDRPESYAYTDTKDTRFGRARAEERQAHAGKSGSHLLDNGLDAFVARAVLAHFAERSIDVQYYLYHDDLVARLFSDQLLKAADRGVRVRVLVDDMDLEGRDFNVAAADSHPNLEIRIFNPFSRKVGRTSQFITRLGSVTRRMHNKSFTVDNQVTIVGGRNMGNEYFDADPDLEFADLDVMAIGPVVGKVSDVFDKYWNSELAYPVSVLIDDKPTPEEVVKRRQELNNFVAEQADSSYMRALQNSDLADKIQERNVQYHWGEAVVVYDQPEKLLHGFDKTEYHLSPMLRPYWEEIKKELIIFSPYFVPGKEGTTFLTDLARRGVRVKIVTNSLSSNDVGVVHAGYSKYRRRLLRGGVELWEMNKKLTSDQRKEKKGTGGSSKASLHAKSFVFDREKIFIGSLNLDPRAVIHNTEIGIIITSSELGSYMGEEFDQGIDQNTFRLELVKTKNGSEKILWHGLVDGKQQTLDTDPYTGFWRRLGIGFLSLLPIESQL